MCDALQKTALECIIDKCIAGIKLVIGSYKRWVVTFKVALLFSLYSIKFVTCNKLDPQYP